MVTDGSAAQQSSASGLQRHDFVTRRAYEEGRREYGPLPLDYAVYARRYVGLTCRRLLASGISATESKVAEALARAAGGDVFLAVACDEGVDGAWEMFTDRYVRRLRGFVKQRGATATQADEIARQLPGELATPPANAEASTRLGVYDGSASLFSWLAVICLRRLVDRRRAAATRPMSMANTPEGVTPRREDPSRIASEHETAERFRAALAATWPRLTCQESLALLWKHRDGLRQKRIAVLLDVGAPRVSRILRRAIEKLRAALPPEIGAADWNALGRAFQKHMETMPAAHELRGREPSQ